MKNVNLIGFLMIVASSFMFIQCTSDVVTGPQGVAGIDGVDGVNGINGTDGVDGTASCVTCHSESHRTAIGESYVMSDHAKNIYKEGPLTTYTSKSYFNGSCSRCHSNEGYINYITGKPAVTIANPTPVSCTTCHSKHSTFDFENDGHDFALRNMDPVTLDQTDETYTIDYGNASNNCVSCHQPRSNAPVDDGTGLYLQANSRFYPHYGGQSTMLEGIQGAIIEGGSTAYPEVGTAGHRTGASCTSCHMSSSTDGLTGAHTMIPNLESCTTCHASGVPTDVTFEDNETLTQKMATLHDKLFNLGLITEAGDTPEQTENIPFKHAQALWNYQTVKKDHSHGIHNPKYAKALILNALEVFE